MNKEETTMPAAEWLNKYESMKEKLACKTDLDAHFTEKVIGSMAAVSYTHLSAVFHSGSCLTIIDYSESDKKSKKKDGTK